MLEQELDAFMKQLPEMLKSHQGKWVAFRNNEHLNYWDTQTDCIEEAYREWGYVPILARQVSNEYQIYGEYGKPRSIMSLVA